VIAGLGGAASRLRIIASVRQGTPRAGAQTDASLSDSGLIQEGLQGRQPTGQGAGRGCWVRQSWATVFMLVIEWHVWSPF
jgi:hypothetical protein